MEEKFKIMIDMYGYNSDLVKPNFDKIERCYDTILDNRLNIESVEFLCTLLKNKIHNTVSNRSITIS